jgi:RNA polymerase sigma-70 factor, ECF subfamily
VGWESFILKSQTHSNHSTLPSLNAEGENPLHIQMLKDRDPEFLRELFIDINPRLIRLMASKGLFAETAEEIIHECWETFFINLDKFEGRSTIRTFIFGILINKIRENRRRTSRIDYEEDSEKVFERSFTENGWWMNEPTDPYQLLANQELGESIKDCLNGLTDSQRAAFLLIESEGENSESACQIMGVSLSNLRVLIFRAKDKLRACLEGNLNSEMKKT